MTLEEIAKRDAESAETWFRPFQGPQQFGAAGRAFVDRRWLLAHISTLRNDLTAARLERDEARNDLQEVVCGDVMYTSLGRETERLRHEVSRLNQRCQYMGWSLYPHSDPPREAVAGDIGWPG